MAYPLELYPDPEGFNPATERFRVGQFVRVNDPKSTVKGCAARIISVSNGWRVAEHVYGTGLFDASSLEPWTPRTAERVRITACSAYPELVGRVVTYNERRELGHKFSIGDDTYGLPDTLVEFEPVFEEAEKRELTGDEVRRAGEAVAVALDFKPTQWPYPFYDSQLEVGAPDVRIKPNEALVREAERKMKADVDKMRE